MKTKELDFTKALKRNDKGKGVKAVQEWLTLHHNHVSTDGDFGPATEAAVIQFQKKRKLGGTGVVDEATWKKLVEPLAAALAPISPNGKSFSRLVVAYARQHLRQHPREIGGDNRGPWVRLYMDGNEGDTWFWCAGFATYCLRQAAETLGVEVPIERTYSCDVIATEAKREARFIPEASAVGKVKPGSLFLVRRTSNDWTHVGIVVKAAQETFQTVEGNTNDEGSRNGYEVCARTRSYSGRDFVRL
jgi:peptidoglycan hydrolase-like protein with peptidoglycan-binding domain